MLSIFGNDEVNTPGEKKLIMTEPVKPKAVKWCCTSLDLVHAQASPLQKLFAINSRRGPKVKNLLKQG